MTSVKFRTKFGNLPDDRIKFINEDSSGRIWIGTMQGLGALQAVFAVCRLKFGT